MCLVEILEFQNTQRSEASFSYPAQIKQESPCPQIQFTWPTVILYPYNIQQQTPTFLQFAFSWLSGSSLISKKLQTENSRSGLIQTSCKSESSYNCLVI